MDVGKFQDLARSLGTQKDSHVVLYCDNAMLFSTRVWWCFKYFGLKNVSVLDGGWNSWVSGGHPVALKSAKSVPATGDNAFVASIQPDRVADTQAVLEAVSSSDQQIWDSRTRK